MSEASSEFFDDNDLIASGGKVTSGGDYVLGEKIYVSESGFTQLHLMRRLGRLFIAKSLRREYRGNEVAEAALRKEFQIGFAIDSKGAVRTFDFSTHPEIGSFIALEYCRGVNLRELMESGKEITGRCLENISDSLMETVRAIHGEGIIHRDIKPSNVIYDEMRGDVKLIDFGCADAFDQSMFKGRAGTEFYKSDEFINQPADDWYALSLTLSELAEHCKDRRAVKRVLSRCRNMKKGLSEGTDLKKKRRKRVAIISAAAVILIALLSVFIFFEHDKASKKNTVSYTHQQAIKFIDKKISTTTHDVYVDRLMRLMDQMDIYGVDGSVIEAVEIELSDEEEVTRSIMARIRPYLPYLPNDLPRDTIDNLIKHYYQVYFTEDGQRNLLPPEEMDSVRILLGQQKPTK